MFLLVAPESAGADHLKALAQVARMFREPSLIAKVRATRDASGLFSVLTQTSTPNAA
jgi:PTS system nitrogen regulatory IIA component